MPSLILKLRVFGTRKWPILSLANNIIAHSHKIEILVTDPGLSHKVLSRWQKHWNRQKWKKLTSRVQVFRGS